MDRARPSEFVPLLHEQGERDRGETEDFSVESNLQSRVRNGSGQNSYPFILSSNVVRRRATRESLNGGKYHFPRSNIWASPNKRISVLSLRRASTSTPRFSGLVCCVNEDSREPHTHTRTHVYIHRQKGEKFAIGDRREEMHRKDGK